MADDAEARRHVSLRENVLAYHDFRRAGGMSDRELVEYANPSFVVLQKLTSVGIPTSLNNGHQPVHARA